MMLEAGELRWMGSSKRSFRKKASSGAVNPRLADLSSPLTGVCLKVYAQETKDRRFRVEFRWSSAM